MDALHAAIERHDVDGIRRCIRDHKVDVNATFVTKYNLRLTPLLWVAQFGSVEDVDMLVAAGANVNAVDANGVTPLMGSIEKNKTATVHRLLDHGASLNHVSAYGNTVLHYCTIRGRDDIIQRLLDMARTAVTADQEVVEPSRVSQRVVEYLKINRLDFHSETPLMYASSRGFVGIVDQLLAVGADVQVEMTRWNVGWTALMQASLNGHVAIVEKLLAVGARIDHASQNGETAIHVAACQGREGTVELLLAAGGNPNVDTNDGMTPLMCAAKRGSLRIVDMLLAANANVASVSERWGTALTGACEADSLELVTRLIAAGTELNHARNDGMMPLMIAATQGNVNIVRMLLDGDADANCTNADGYNALMLALANVRTRVAELLLPVTLDVHQIGNNGNTALILASGYSTRYMWSRPARYANEVFACIVHELLARGAHVHHVNGQGETALMAAWRMQHSSIAEALMVAGANAALVDTNAWMPEQRPPRPVPDTSKLETLFAARAAKLFERGEGLQPCQLKLGCPENQLSNLEVRIRSRF